MKQQHKSWRVLMVLCGLAAASIGISINTSGVFYSVVSQDLGILRGSFAFNMTIFSLVNAIAGLFVTNFLKELNFKLLLTISVVIGILSTGLMGMSSHLWQFYLLAVIRGFSVGMFSIMTLTLIINYWFVEKNGLATSIAFSFSGITGALMSPIFAKFILSHGWRMGYWLQAFFIFLFCLPAILYPFKIDPEKEGLKAYGHKEEKGLESDDIKPFNFSISFLAVIIFAVSCSFISSMTQHFPGFADSIGLSVTTGAGLLSMAMIGNILSKLAVGYLSDKIGAIKASCALIITVLVAIFLLLISKNPALLLLAAFLFGSSFGVIAVSIPLVTRHIFGFQNYGKAYPLINFATNFGAAIAFSIIGYIFDFTKSYYPALSFFLFLLVISMFSLFYANKHAHY
ncbi:MFS transporter [Streptococcus catagoni]|uniref:MFS transporter n=1 Tax=Streptococcus catagoni TaxID=2654874 RepID=UPI001407771F|nr:MFS transporter [Streptococcus catagoni]